VHELGLLRGVVATVEKAARDNDATKVRAVGLRVGTFGDAVPEALDGAWPLAIAGTSLEGAELVIEEVAATVWCPRCQAAQPIDEFYALTCPVCGTPTGQLLSGREFEVTFADMDLPEDPVPGEPATG